MRLRTPPALVCAALLSWAAPVGAEIYVWTDAAGRTHLTDDPSQVPADQRRAAARAAAEEGEGARWNEIEGANAAVHRAPSGLPEPRTAKPHDPSRQHVLQVQPAGREMVVEAELDGAGGAAFVVDTGAMLNTIPRKVVTRLGLRIEEDAPVTAIVGIDGLPRLAPLVTVQSVRVGTAQVENVEFAVIDTMDHGLLGMPFFNHFRVHTDPRTGTLTLEEIDLAGIEGVYAGLDESGWRQQFRWLRDQRERVADARRRVDPMYVQVHEKLGESAEYWQSQLDQLELKASRAGVPRAWRE